MVVHCSSCLRNLKQEDGKFQASLGNIARPCTYLKTKQRNSSSKHPAPSTFARAELQNLVNKAMSVFSLFGTTDHLLVSKKREVIPVWRRDMKVTKCWDFKWRAKSRVFLFPLFGSVWEAREAYLIFQAVQFGMTKQK